MTVGLTRRLSRTKPHRMALMRNLASQLFQYELVVSTTPKLKEAQRYAEKIITIAKRARKDPAKHIPELQSRLYLSGDNSKLLNKLLNDIAGRYEQRNGGYTRLMKLEPRLGDRAPSSTLELVDKVVAGSGGNLQRGNMKLWLNIKAVMYAKSQNKDVSENTTRNLVKMSKVRGMQDFLADVSLIHKTFLDYHNIQTSEEEVEAFVENVKKTIVDYAPRKIEPKGYKFVSLRPQNQ